MDGSLDTVMGFGWVADVGIGGQVRWRIICPHSEGYTRPVQGPIKQASHCIVDWNQGYVAQHGCGERRFESLGTTDEDGNPHH